jgi:hypothetical protein
MFLPYVDLLPARSQARNPQATYYRCPASAAEAKFSSELPEDRYDEGRLAMARQRKNPLLVFTIGHSTRSIEEFIELLQSNGIKRLVDIRTIPKSRHNPQFNSDELAASLSTASIEYTHLKALGGLRHARKDSENMGWRNASFRGYADYMQTPEFAEGIERAIQLAEERPTALMCAEAVPWRCHRSLVADALLVRGIEVREIISSSSPEEHKLTPFAVVRGTKITYPKEETSLQMPLIKDDQ